MTKPWTARRDDEAWKRAGKIESNNIADGMDKITKTTWFSAGADWAYAQGLADAKLAVSPNIRTCKCDELTKMVAELEAERDALKNENDRLALELINLGVEHPCYQLSKELEAELDDLKWFYDRVSKEVMPGSEDTKDVVMRILREHEALTAKLQKAKEALSNLLGSISEPTFQDSRLSYVEVQVDPKDIASTRETLKELEGE